MYDGYTIEQIIRVNYMSYRLREILYEQLLADKSLKRVALSCLQYPDENMLQDIIRYTSDINRIAKKEYYVHNNEIIIKKKMKKGLKKFTNL